MENDQISGIDALKSNLTHEKNIIREIFIFLNQLDSLNSLEGKGVRVGGEEKRLLKDTIVSLLAQLKILNESIPEILKKVSIFKELPSKAVLGKTKGEKENLISLEYKHPSIKEEKGVYLIIKKADRLRFLRELSLTDDSIRRLKKEYKLPKEKIEEFKKPSAYARISNKLFSKTSAELISKGYFAGLSKELRKANLYFLSQTYISMAFFTSFISIFVALAILIALLFFSFSLQYPFLIQAEESILLRLLKFFWLIFALPAITFLAFYFYPSAERKSISSRINQELPFVVIHMSAIAGSGIEPTKIFRIIVLSREYPNTRKEFKKLLNEVNVYGYDVVTALVNSSRITSSVKLAELFKGLATAITSGGNLKDFLDKRAESLIFDYRIEREKYTRMAETFMDIYISVVIAAPMMMTILLVMMSMIEFGFNLTLNALTFLMVAGVALLNIFFLVFLHLKQPEA